MKNLVFLAIFSLSIQVVAQELPKNQISVFGGFTNEVFNVNAAIVQSPIGSFGLDLSRRIVQKDKFNVYAGLGVVLYGHSRDGLLLFEDDIDATKGFTGFTDYKVRTSYLGVSVPIKGNYGSQFWVASTGIRPGVMPNPTIKRSLVDQNGQEVELPSSSMQSEIFPFISLSQSLQYKIAMGDKVILVGPEIEFVLNQIRSTRLFRAGINCSILL